MAHDEPCPMCLGRRYTNCPACGGHLARSALIHFDTSGDSGLAEALASLDSSSRSGAIGGSGEARGRQQLLEQMDALANEIMAD